jgi:hypothetical protein
MSTSLSREIELLRQIELLRRIQLVALYQSALGAAELQTHFTDGATTSCFTCTSCFT